MKVVAQTYPIDSTTLEANSSAVTPYSQTTYDFYHDGAVTVALSQTALVDLLLRISAPPEDMRCEYSRGSFEYLADLDRCVAIIPTRGVDRITVATTEVGVWLSGTSLLKLITGCSDDLSYVLSLPKSDVGPAVDVIGERDGFRAACRLWPTRGKAEPKY
jgi:hypothetical protein